MYKVIVILFVVLAVQSIIKIVQPVSNPFPKSEIDYSIANFGDIPYGKTIKGELELYSQRDLCTIDAPISHSNAIVVAIRGGCNFVTKAENAQNIGAKMILIVDNIDEKQKIIMADDGRGKLIHIPALFIDYEDGEKLTNMLTKNITVKILMKLDVNMTDIAEVRFWLSASLRETYILMREFRPYFNNLETWLKLNVSYYSHRCAGCAVQDCYQGDKAYCQTDGINNQLGNGAHILQEQFIQYAIFKYNINQWFEYMDSFDKQCIQQTYASSCSKNILRQMNIQDAVLVFYDNLNRSNLLKVWAEEMTNGSVWTIPDATINGVYYRGTVDASDIAEISCASLKQRPKGCSEFFEEPVSDSSSMTAVLVILMALFMAVMIGAIIIMVYRKTVRREITNEMSTKVTEMVTKYASLVEEHQRKGKQKDIQRSREDL